MEFIERCQSQCSPCVMFPNTTPHGPNNYKWLLARRSSGYTKSSFLPRTLHSSLIDSSRLHWRFIHWSIVKSNIQCSNGEEDISTRLGLSFSIHQPCVSLSSKRQANWKVKYLCIRWCSSFGVQYELHGFKTSKRGLLPTKYSSV